MVDDMTDSHVRAVRTLLRQAPLIDGHNDLALALLEQGHDPDDGIDRLPAPFHSGLARLRAGKVGAQVWTVFRDAELRGEHAVIAALEQFDRIHRMIARHPERTELVTRADRLEEVFAAGKLASLIGVEGGHLIGGSLSTLRTFARLGMRYLGLTHNLSHDWADSATDGALHGGLSSFGARVVRELNRLGVLVDLAHAAESTGFDALAVSDAPVIVSHGNAKALCPHPRNVSDPLASAIAASGGVVMVTFVPYFLTPESARWSRRLIAAHHRLRVLHGRAGLPAALDAWVAQHRPPVVRLHDVADHLDHFRNLIGAEHVGIGSDYDGVDALPVGLESPAQLPRLLAELRLRGWRDDELVAVAGGNFLRVLRSAEAVAATS